MSTDSPQLEIVSPELTKTWRIFNRTAKLALLILPIAFAISTNIPGKLRFNFGSPSTSYVVKLNVGTGQFFATQFETTAAGFPRRYMLRQIDPIKGSEHLWWSAKELAVNIGFILILSACLVYQFVRSRTEIPFWQLSILQILSATLFAGGLVTWIQQRRTPFLSDQSNISNSHGIMLRSASYSPLNPWSESVKLLTLLNTSWSVEADLSNPNDKSFQNLGNELWLEKMTLANMSDDQFEYLPKLDLLRSIDCQDSTIGPKAIAWFQSLPNLEWLDLQKCNCKDIPSDAFAKLDRVECLDLRGSDLPKGILDGTNQLRALRALYVDSTQITKNFWGSLDGHSNLKTLIVDWLPTDLDRKSMIQGDSFAGKTINIKLHDVPNLETIRIPYAPIRLELGNLPKLQTIEPIPGEQSIFDLPAIARSNQIYAVRTNDFPNNVRTNPSPFAKGKPLLIRTCSIQQCPKLELSAIVPLTDDNIHSIEGPIGKFNLAVIADRKGKKLEELLSKLQNSKVNGSLSIHMNGSTRLDTTLIPSGLQDLCIDGLRVENRIPSLEKLQSLNGLVFRNSQISLDQFESCLYDIPHLQIFEANGKFDRIAVRDRYELTSLKIRIPRPHKHCDIEILGCTRLRECQIQLLCDSYSVNLEDASQLGMLDLLFDNEGRMPKLTKYVLGGEHNLMHVSLGANFQFGEKPLKPNIRLNRLAFNNTPPGVIESYLTRVNPQNLDDVELNEVAISKPTINALALTRSRGLVLKKVEIRLPEMIEAVFHPSRVQIVIENAKIVASDTETLADVNGSKRRALSSLNLANSEVAPEAVQWMVQNFTVDQLTVSHSKLDLANLVPILIGQQASYQVDRMITVTEDMLTDEFYAALGKIETSLRIGTIDYRVPDEIAFKLSQHQFFHMKGP